MYSELRPDCILETITQLEHRIEQSFPGSGLSRVAVELHALARDAGPVAGWLSRPNWALRVGAGLGIGAVIGALYGITGLAAGVSLRVDGVAELIQVTESAVNEVVLVALAIVFLASLETRFKRSRALAALHRLRSIVHVVDMHQLTKDPQHLLAPCRTPAAHRSAATHASSWRGTWTSAPSCSRWPASSRRSTSST